eukprot:9336818-Ditylum_brightwellii.AAC.1
MASQIEIIVEGVTMASCWYCSQPPFVLRTSRDVYDFNIKHCMVLLGITENENTGPYDCVMRIFITSDAVGMSFSPSGKANKEYYYFLKTMTLAPASSE